MGKIKNSLRKAALAAGLAAGSIVGSNNNSADAAAVVNLIVNGNSRVMLGQQETIKITEDTTQLPSIMFTGNGGNVQWSTSFFSFNSTGLTSPNFYDGFTMNLSHDSFTQNGANKVLMDIGTLPASLGPSNRIGDIGYVTLNANTVGSTSIVLNLPTVVDSTGASYTVANGKLAATSLSLSIVANRVITTTKDVGSPLAFGNVMTGYDISGVAGNSATLASTAADNTATRLILSNGTANGDGLYAIVNNGNSFTFNGNLSTSAKIGGSFNSAGSKSGTVTTGVTGEGLNGEVDTAGKIAYTGTVYNHAVPSFNTGSQVLSAIMPLRVVQGSTATVPYTLANLVNTVGYTAPMNLENLAVSGPQASFITSGANTFNGMAAGNSNNYIATVNANVAPVTSGVSNNNIAFTMGDTNANIAGGGTLGNLNLSIPLTIAPIAELIASGALLNSGLTDRGTINTSLKNGIYQGSLAISPAQNGKMTISGVPTNGTFGVLYDIGNLGTDYSQSQLNNLKTALVNNGYSVQFASNNGLSNKYDLALGFSTNNNPNALSWDFSGQGLYVKEVGFVPEPATLALLTMGGLMMMPTRKSQRNRRGRDIGTKVSE